MLGTRLKGTDATGKHERTQAYFNLSSPCNNRRALKTKCRESVQQPSYGELNCLPLLLDKITKGKLRMAKVIMLRVSKCGECPHLDINTKGRGSCAKAGYFYYVYEENKEGITPSCPLWEEAVDEE